MLLECMARCGACATALQRSKVQEMQTHNGQRPSVSSDTLDFPKEECPAHFGAWFDLRYVGW